ncbi:NAD(P)-binding protein [Pseudovirgaria hyperparasitica]|uniref:NAD(P)-binding protein n=1 Tax=Pseudovirgaria hyperparasitica TaxID=470096 RepID=A0A6A6W3P3_9PEZI|nr:NAD(P)-binding protein [Pseudovirgaria hyperparasitica]KAF2755661.1 NAD(P)-binding protein [Pseudovirgaria hyperparasitica]
MNAIKTTLAENLGGIAGSFAPQSGKFSLEEVPQLDGKVALVTGGSEGIGYGCTHTLLSKNVSKLFIISLSKDIADDAINAIREEMGEASAKKVRWLSCDLSDWNATGKIAQQIAGETDRLDILINGAARGIMSYQEAPTNGIDQHLATNHFGHVVLTSHLLPLLEKTADAGNTVRVVCISSNLHESTPKETQFASIEEINKDYGPNAQYARSKLANLLYAKYLARHASSAHPNLLVNAIHPGIVETRQTSEHILEAYPLGGYAMKYGMALFKKTQFEGCVSTMFAATTTTNTGQYICPPAIVEKGSDKANDMELMEQLMKITKEIVEQKTGAEEKGCPMRAA